jgi:hypothetical protein
MFGGSRTAVFDSEAADGTTRPSVQDLGERLGPTSEGWRVPGIADAPAGPATTSC